MVVSGSWISAEVADLESGNWYWISRARERVKRKRKTATEITTLAMMDFDFRGATMGIVAVEMIYSLYI